MKEKPDGKSPRANGGSVQRVLVRAVARELCREYCYGFRDYNEKNRISEAQIERYVQYNSRRWIKKAKAILSTD